MDGSKHTNRLIREKSPYLLQHAHNPVDWYSWGEEAFEAAKAQDKPIFLSIGFATCHWCHVMEKESFENVEIAKLLNDAFINIKVDREERPEVDNVYMELAQVLMSTPGGWPLNLVLTADKKPFFAMTYLPPNNRRGSMGMDEFIEHIKTIWNSPDRALLVEQADKLVEVLAKAKPSVGTDMPTIDHLNLAIQPLLEIADPIYGGIRGTPKFPLGYQSNFLMNYSKVHKDSRTLFFVQLTLDMMHRGGIYDHLGGGFSRYSVDEHWMVPHFEKMAYDNAILANAYLDAWRYTHNPHYRTVVEEILGYVIRDLLSPDGGFYSAEDADSDGKEGAYYTWTWDQVHETLPKEDADLFCKFYGVTKEGNFSGRNVLYLPLSLEEFAEKNSLSPLELHAKLQGMRSILFASRSKRNRPFKDDKILTSWNGLMIDTFARAGFYCGKSEYSHVALKAAEFIKSHLFVDGVLLHRYRDQESRFAAVLDDYVFLIRALLTLFETHLGSQWLAWAVQLSEYLRVHFKNPSGAFFQTAEENAVLLRKCDFYDGAEPSSNAVHAENLIRLFQFTGESGYLDQAEDILKAAKEYIEAYPPGACYHLLSLNRYLDKNAPTLVVALNQQGELKSDIEEALKSHFSPHLCIVWKDAGDQEIEKLLPHLQKTGVQDGKTVIYICRGDACSKPVVGKEEILNAIANL